MHSPLLEYYPDVPKDALQAAWDLVSKNIPHYEAPFFMEPYTHVNVQEIKKVCDPFLAKDLKNIIVLGTGGSIQTLLALQYFASRRIVPLTSSRPSELKEALKTTTPKDSVVVPISRGGETLDVTPQSPCSKTIP